MGPPSRVSGSRRAQRYWHVPYATAASGASAETEVAGASVSAMPRVRDLRGFLPTAKTTVMEVESPEAALRWL
ncbi:MAG: hypothetical protein M0027_00715 [Candidatus Dormibacteraeota bacterium]|nr:hypothetical protein [Candidatus Dormibacteraeota bacterium]